MKMKNSINILINFLFIFYCNNVFALQDNKILFSIKDEIYTTIDLSDRKKFLSIKDNLILNENIQIKDDYISAILLSLFFDNYMSNVEIKNFINQEYNTIVKRYADNSNNSNNSKVLKIYNDIDKKIIYRNLEYDIKRKIIIESELNKKKEQILKYNINQISNIYNIKLTFISVNKKDFKNIKLQLNKKLNYDELILKLDKHKITYMFQENYINTYEDIPDNIKKAITKNENEFEFYLDSNLIKGKISRTLKDENFIKINLKQINSLKPININIIKCDNLNNINENHKIEILDIDNLEYNKLNDQIKNNLIKKNDVISYKEHNTYKYVLLCNITYDDDTFKEININEKIEFFVSEIEKEIIIKAKNIFSFINFNE